METPTPPELRGSCLCGAVRYTVRPDRLEGYYCHCRMCQRAFGNTRAAFINVRKDQVAWTAHPPARYASSKIAVRGFCGHCGTPLSFEYLSSDRMDLAVGSLEDPGAIQPVEHYAVESRVAAWHAPDGLAERRLDEDMRLAERWREADDGAPPGPGTHRNG